MKLLIPLVREIMLYICQEKVREFRKPLAVASMNIDYAAEV